MSNLYYIAPTTAPMSVEILSNGTSGITVGWKKLDCHCNGDITGYSVQCEEDEGRDKQERHVKCNVIKATFPSLISSTTYSFRVAAKNSSGIGVYSDDISEDTKPGG